MIDKDLKELFIKVNEYIKTRFNDSIDYIKIYGDGELIGVSQDYRCNYDDSEYSINIEELSEDLLIVAEKRRIELEEQKKKEEIERERQRLIREKREKEERYNKFIELKKEFE